MTMPGTATAAVAAGPLLPDAIGQQGGSVNFPLSRCSPWHAAQHRR